MLTSCFKSSYQNLTDYDIVQNRMTVPGVPKNWKTLWSELFSKCLDPRLWCEDKFQCKFWKKKLFWKFIKSDSVCWNIRGQCYTTPNII